MTTAEHKVSLFLEQNLDKPVLEYFDPLRFLEQSPMIIAETMLDLVCEWYVEKSRQLTLIDLYYLHCLNKEAIIQNLALSRMFDKKEVTKKLKLFFTLYNVADFNSLTGAVYFQRFPHGRVSYTK